MVVTGPSLSHLTLARKHFIKNSNTAFHEDPINPIVTDIVSPKRGVGVRRRERVSPGKELLFVT
jgi:hypothetical protein